MDEVQAKLEEIRNMTDLTKRQAAMEKLRTDLQTWAEKNDLADKQYLLWFGGHRGGRGFGGPGMGGPGGFGGPGGGCGRGNWGPPSSGTTTTTNAQQSSTQI